MRPSDSLNSILNDPVGTKQTPDNLKGLTLASGLRFRPKAGAQRFGVVLFQAALGIVVLRKDLKQSPTEHRIRNVMQ